MNFTDEELYAIYGALLFSESEGVSHACYIEDGEYKYTVDETDLQKRIWAELERRGILGECPGCKKMLRRTQDLLVVDSAHFCKDECIERYTKRNKYRMK